MATINDVDTKTLVRKFLERRVVSSQEEQDLDTSDEIQAVLEACAIAFLVNPQTALSLILLSKNLLQQAVSKDSEIIAEMIKAIGDIDNPDEPITDVSDLIEARTALVELDRVGRIEDGVQSYVRYTESINRFLDNELAKPLKRRRRREFERSGPEAKEDLFRLLALFLITHKDMQEQLARVVASVSNFQSVDLTRIVSTKTVTRVRSSLQKILRGASSNSMSKTVIALELLAGAAALKSVSNAKGIYDPLVETGSYPVDRTVTVSSEPTKAKALSSQGPWDISLVSTPWNFDLEVNGVGVFGVSYSLEIPAVGVSGRVYVKSSVAAAAATHNIPAGYQLYLQIEEGTTVDQIVVALTSGASVPIATTAADINTALVGYGFCSQVDGNRLIIYGTAPKTKIIVRSYGDGAMLLGAFVPADPSAHSILGFDPEAPSLAMGVFTAATLADALAYRAPLATFSDVDGKLQVESNSELPDSSVAFSGVASEFGLSGETGSLPLALQLMEDGQAVDPVDLGVVVGSHVTMTDNYDATRGMSARISSIDGTRLLFSTVATLPRGSENVTTVLAPAVSVVQSLIDEVKVFTSSFSEDNQDVEQILTPLLSRATLAQINDARGVLTVVQEKIDNLLLKLSQIFLPEDQAVLGDVAKTLLSGLEERGMDRASDLLKSSRFSEFFSLTKEVASKSSRLMRAIEEIGRKDFPVTTIEQDIEELQPVGTSTDELPATEPSEE